MEASEGLLQVLEKEKEKHLSKKRINAVQTWLRCYNDDFYYKSSEIFFLFNKNRAILHQQETTFCILKKFQTKIFSYNSE